MAQRAGAAMDVDLGMRQVVFFHRRHRDHRKGFVDFIQIDIRAGPAGLVVELLDRTHRCGGEPLWFLRVSGMRNQPGNLTGPLKRQTLLKVKLKPLW